MAELQLPNFFASYVQGQKLGQEHREQRQAMIDKNALRQLAPGVIGGDINALTQAAAIDPTIAGKYDEVNVDIAKRGAGAAAYLLDAVKRGNPQEIEGRYQSVVPFLTKVGAASGKVPSPNFDPAMVPLMEQLVARSQGMGDGTLGRVQSTYVDGDGNRIAIMADGTKKVLGANDLGMSQQTITINGPDGRPAQYTFDKRTGGYVPAQMGGYSSALGAPMQQGQPTQPGTQSAPLPQGGTQPVIEQIMASANQLIAQGIPEAQVDAWVQQQLQPSGGNQLQTTQAVVPGPSPFVGRSPEEQASLTEDAKLRTQIGYLPQQQQIETQGALDRARGQAEIETSQKRMEGEAKARLSLDQAGARIQRVDALVDEILPRINSMTAGWIGGKLSGVDGTAAADLRRDIGTLQAIAGFDELAAMRASSPTGGALGSITEKELMFLQSVVRNIENAQSPKQLHRNLQEFRREVKGSWDRVNQAYMQDYGQARQPSASPQGQLGGFRILD